jgi:hypothetical protein
MAGNPFWKEIQRIARIMAGNSEIPTIGALKYFM